MEGFYKFDGENWYYAPHFVYAKDYILAKDGNREETDGWKWYDEEPLEYTIFIIVFAIAFFTEIYDEFFKSKFDLLDLIATQLGFFLALLIKLIIYFFN